MGEPVKLPEFTYHPDPVATGNVEASESPCICCGQKRELIYTGPVYAEKDYKKCICPWCIATGSAAEKLGASFSDVHSLLQKEIAPEIIEEIRIRTPGYSSWQGEHWLCHCNDACEFHGDASFEDVRNASSETKEHWMRENNLGEDEWLDLTEDYRPQGDPAIYKFKCRHCGLILFGWDCS